MRRARAALFLLAAAVRLLHVWGVHDHWAVRYRMVDARSYHAQALAILGGDWRGHAVFFQDPLYPYFLAGLYALLGPDSPWVLAAQALLDAGTVLLATLLAERVFGARTALLAGGLAAFYEPFLLFDALHLKEPLATFLLTLALWLLVRADARPAQGSGWLAAGAALGLAGLARGPCLVLAPVAFGWLALARWRPRRERLAPALWLALGLALAILPVTARNQAVGGDPVLIHSGLGANLYIGNQRANDSGRYRAPPFVRPHPAFEEADFRAEAERRAGHALAPSQASSFWLREALAEIAADPGHFLRHTAWKARLYLNHFEVPDNESLYYFAAHVAPWLALPGPSFGALLPFALVGLWLAPRTRGAALLVAFLLVYSAGVIAFFVVSRYRIPVAPVGIAFAAHAMAQLWGLARARAWRRLAPLTLGLAAAWVVVHQDLLHDDLAISHFNLGGMHNEQAKLRRARARELERAGELEAARAAHAAADRFLALAESEFQQGLEIRPRHPRLRGKLREVLLHRAEAAREAGDEAAAREAARALAAAFPRQALPPLPESAPPPAPPAGSP